MPQVSPAPPTRGTRGRDGFRGSIDHAAWGNDARPGAPIPAARALSRKKSRRAPHSVRFGAPLHRIISRTELRLHHVPQHGLENATVFVIENVDRPIQPHEDIELRDGAVGLRHRELERLLRRDRVVDPFDGERLRPRDAEALGVLSRVTLWGSPTPRRAVRRRRRSPAPSPASCARLRRANPTRTRECSPVPFAPRAAAASSVQSPSSRAAMSRIVAAQLSPYAAMSWALRNRAGSVWK